MKTISKSKYMGFKNCARLVWLLQNKPELAETSESALKNMREGKIVGECAKSYFTNTFDVTSFDKDGNLDIDSMIGLTNRYLLENKETIAEASFSVDGLYCSVDLLHKNNDNYDIYEVKASTKIEKDHLIDVAFQKYVLEKRGLKVVNVYVVYINNDYRRHGNLELKKLFSVQKVSDKSLFLQTYSNLKNDIEAIRLILNKKTEPSVSLSSTCKECPFKNYCQRDLPKPNVLSLAGNSGGDKYARLNSGIITFQDVSSSDMNLSDFQKAQIDSFLYNKEIIVDKERLRSFLETIRYPVYHLDFESIMSPIPPCDNTWPYEQIPTQYSLHIEFECGRLEHKEFLGNSLDPRRDIAEALCRDIPLNSCVLVFNKTFECGRLKELAELFPDLKDHLLNLKDNVIDLAWPFEKGVYYHRKMENRYSIKWVLPALYPSDPDLDYHSLPVVHNGNEAMDIYPKMLEANSKEKEEIRNGLLQYCCLDTLAMVKILTRLKETLG